MAGRAHNTWGGGGGGGEDLPIIVNTILELIIMEEKTSSNGENVSRENTQPFALWHALNSSTDRNFLLG